MGNIQNELNNIKTALYGKDVRNSIHDAIKTCYDDASVNNDNANMEVKLARGTHNTLNDRLCEVDEKQNSLSSQLAHIDNNKVDLRVVKPSHSINEVQEILNTKHNGILNVVFSKGEYNLNSLRIKKNTHIILDEAIINVTSRHLFYNFETNDTFKEYEGNGNIVIEGGIVNGHLISMIHAKDVIIKNVTMQRCSNDHYIEICASNNILIDNCIIDGVKTQEQGRNYVECIQLDVCQYDSFPWLSSESLMFDNTPNKNITIKNCDFKNTSTLHKLYTGIGSNVVDSDNPSKDINIIGCSFYGSHSHAINVMGWESVNIKDCLFEDCLLAICSNTYARTLVIENCHFKSCKEAILTKNGGGYNFIIKNNIIEDTVNSIGELNDIISLKFNSNYLTNNHGRISFKRTRNAIIDNNIFKNPRLTNFNHLLNIDGEREYVYSFTICNNFFGDYSEGGFDEYYCINLNNEYTFQIKQHSNNVGGSYNYVIAYNNNPANLYPINKLDEFIITTSHDLKYNDSFINLDKKVNLNFRIYLKTPIQQNTWTKIASTLYTGDERTLYVSSANYDRMTCIINKEGINLRSETELDAGQQLRFLGVFTMQ